MIIPIMLMTKTDTGVVNSTLDSLKKHVITDLKKPTPYLIESERSPSDDSELYFSSFWRPYFLSLRVTKSVARAGFIDTICGARNTICDAFVKKNTALAKVVKRIASARLTGYSCQ